MARRRFAGVLVTAVVLLVGSAGPATAATGGQRLTVIYTGAEGSPGVIVLSGIVTGVGTEQDSGDVGVITLPGGTISVSHPPTADSSVFNHTTCLLTLSFVGTYAFTGGTGAYAGISGSGTYKATGLQAFDHTPNGCSDTPRFGFALVNGSGSTALPGR